MPVAAAAGRRHAHNKPIDHVPVVEEPKPPAHDLKVLPPRDERIFSGTMAKKVSDGLMFDEIACAAGRDSATVGGTPHHSSGINSV